MKGKHTGSYQRRFEKAEAAQPFAWRISMSVTLKALFAGAVLSAAGALVGDASAAETVDGCKVDQAGAQKIWSCPGGLTIIEENGARFTLDDRDHDGNIDLVRLWGKALLLDLIEGSGHDVEVVTPQAITAVRGTKWAVDVGDAKTSVFVVRGAVGVRRPHTGGQVVLRAGAGVDVEEGSSPLKVKQWGAPRVAGLMARFGQ
jgi:ferric-dicitrate binding protein FerR (iron transport regulator)